MKYNCPCQKYLTVRGTRGGELVYLKKILLPCEQSHEKNLEILIDAIEQLEGVKNHVEIGRVR